MSKLIVEVCRVEEMRKHPNADRMTIVKLEGKDWTCCTAKVEDENGELVDRYKAGDTCIYIPVDAVLPVELSDKYNVTNYLSKGRVRAAKLRGVTSYGFVVENEDDLPVGTDVAEALGITKYEPPIDFKGGDIEHPHQAFQKYTDIENIKNYADVLKEGEEVVVTEKIHGSNCVHFYADGKFMAASHNHQRKENPESAYWRTFDQNTKDLLKYLVDVEGASSASIYKEVYGTVQKGYAYDAPGVIKDVVFDISVSGAYLDHSTVVDLCDRFGLKMAPILYQGPFDREAINDLVNGSKKGVKTVLGEGSHIMEGVVIKPITERWNDRTGRTIFKWISDAYYLDKNAGDGH